MAIRRSTTRWISNSRRLPDSFRAVLSYYGDSGLGLAEGKGAISLQRHVENRKENVLEGLFSAVNRELSEEFGVEDVDFSYDTKLTFPAELALGEVYDEARAETPANYDLPNRRKRTNLSDQIVRPIFDKKHEAREKERVEEKHSKTLERVSAAEEFTDLVIGLLVEGDIRDALNDEEYGDFETESSLPQEDTAVIAQRTLQEELQPQLDNYPAGVRDAYEKAVDLSMGHQHEDMEFRELFRRARDNPEKAREIITPYREGETESRFSLEWSDMNLPYFASQYERVGVLYDGMFEMYDETGIDIEDDFKKAVVLSTIGAQIWLDDIDDLEEDWDNEQLTPVTAEILSAKSRQTTYENIISLKDQYLNAARDYASQSGSHLTGIGIEYIDKRGQYEGLESTIRDIDR